jgi:hypothetical protein
LNHIDRRQALLSSAYDGAIDVSHGDPRSLVRSQSTSTVRWRGEAVCEISACDSECRDEIGSLGSTLDPKHQLREWCGRGEHGAERRMVRERMGNARCEHHARDMHHVSRQRSQHAMSLA